MLPFPNPMKKDGYFTFVITEEAEVKVTIYTITGKKIRTLDKNQCGKGYNQIYWDGKDEDGDELANNTYFYKITADQAGSSKRTEKIGKFIILK
jgi:flagellar hook assembly protein FlgD